MKFKKMAASLVAASALIITGCSVGDDSSDGKTLSMVNVFEANSTDAHVNRTSFILNSGSTETLVGLDPETNELYPWLAEDWESDDATNWTFVIRDGVTFHNGQPVTAEAVMKSLEHSIEVNPGMEAALRIDSMEADGQVLQIQTEGEYASLPSQLVHYNAVIVDVDDDADYPVGTGAFRFVSFDTTGVAQLEKNPDYWDGEAKLDTVRLTANEDANARMLALQSGESDVIYRPSLESLTALENDSSLTVDAVPGSRVYQLTYNYTGDNSELWSNVDFRKGIDALVDRESITDSVLNGHGIATDNAFPTEVDNAADANMSADPEAALGYFEEASQSIDGLEVEDGTVLYDGAPLTLNIATYIARPELPQIAQAVQANAKDLGIEMNIVTAENIDEYLVENTSWDLATYSQATLTRGDGSYFLNGTFLPDGAQNHSAYDDPELVAMINEFNSTVDIEERNSQMVTIAEYLRDNALNAYIVAPNETAAYKNSVTGWTTPSNEFEFQMITKDLDIE